VRPRTKQDWRSAVLLSPRITDATRVLLLLMADSMKPDQTVSVPRHVLAAQLGRHERRITERLGKAVEAGFLESVTPGHRGHTAVYRCRFPIPGQPYLRDDPQPAYRGTLSVSQSLEPPPDSGLDGGPTTNRADPADVAQTATSAATRRTA
jgi:hypothetical protein